jgi:hypothetical protein
VLGDSRARGREFRLAAKRLLMECLFAPVCFGPLGCAQLAAEVSLALSKGFGRATFRRFRKRPSLDSLFLKGGSKYYKWAMGHRAN